VQCRVLPLSQRVFTFERTSTVSCHLPAGFLSDEFESAPCAPRQQPYGTGVAVTVDVRHATLEECLLDITAAEYARPATRMHCALIRFCLPAGCARMQRPRHVPQVRAQCTPRVAAGDAATTAGCYAAPNRLQPEVPTGAPASALALRLRYPADWGVSSCGSQGKVDSVVALPDILDLSPVCAQCTVSQQSACDVSLMRSALQSHPPTRKRTPRPMRQQQPPRRPRPKPRAAALETSPSPRL
jgi:hypothetical protein